MEATTPTTRQPRMYEAARLTNSNTNVKTKVDDKDIAPSAADPAALRARLKHRTASPSTSATPTYNRVFDTAQQLAELDRLRAQDAAYIRLLEQGRATLVRDAHTEARSRAASSAPTTQDEQQRKRADEAVRTMKAERERAEKAEKRVRALEEALGVAKARVVELEGEVERERRRREEWECGLEQLAMGVPTSGVGTGPAATTAKL